MAIFSRACEYGLRAVIYMARSGADGAPAWVSARRIATELGIPFHFLSKIFQQLGGAGLVVSSRGPKGGVRLARPPSDINLLQIVQALDGSGVFTSCILGLPGCGEDRPCPLHEAWAVERDRLRSLFAEATLDDWVRRMQEGGQRIQAPMARVFARAEVDA
jgi:Rrf2 family protein